MKQYQLAMPQQVYSGETAMQALETLASGHEKAVVFTDAGIRASGILERPLAELDKAAVPYIINDTLPAEPTCDQAQQVIDTFRESNADLIVAVGGGSVMDIADADGVTLLPEIHASYGEKVYEKLAAKGYAVYDFFLPGLMIDALERGSADTLAAWAQEILDKHILTVNMLGCHDGIPMLDLKGLLPEERIQNLIDLIVTRGGMVKNLHGQKNVYYQVNATYYSALGESDAKLLLARAIQLFMPGKPQVWYLDLFAGKNDCEAVARAGEGGHKEINRTNLTKVQIAEALEKPVVKKQLELLRLRRNCPAFAQGAKIQIESCGPELTIEWSCSGHVARLQANLQKLTYRVEIE